MNHKVYQFLNQSLRYLSIIILIVICITMVTNRLWIDYIEKQIIVPNQISFYLLLIIGIILFIIIKPLLQQIQPKHLFWIGTCIWFVLGLHYLFRAGTGWDYFQTDQRYAYDAAIQFNNGNYTILDDYYFKFYPFQLGLVTYNRLIALFSTNIYFFYFVNLICVLVINWCQWQCVKLSFKKQVIENYNLLLSFSFLPLLYFICFIYGNIPGFLAMYLSLYFGLAYLQQERPKKRYIVYMIVLALLAYLVKNNYLISCLALAIVFGLQALKQQRWKLLIVSAAFIFGMGLTNFTLTKAYQAETGVDLGQGIPKVAWITMGHRYGELRDSYGLYEAYTQDLFEAMNYDTKKTQKIATKDLKKRLHELYTSPSKWWHFYSMKLKQTWADPYFQSIRSTSNTYDLYYPIANNIHSKEVKKRGYYKLAVALNIVNVTIVFFALMNLSRPLFQINNYQTFILLFVVGGFIFHFFWEIKSQYMFQYVYCLIPLASCTLAQVSISKLIKNVHKITKITKKA